MKRKHLYYLNQFVFKTMKKQKLSLEELKVESFVTNQNQVKGGSSLICSIISILEIAPTVIETPIEVGASIVQSIMKMSDECNDFSAELDCTFSA